MRLTLRRAVAVGSMLTLIGVVAPAAAAHSEDDPRSCRDLMGADAPAFIQCRWLAKPDEAFDVVKFWADNDNANLKEATPYGGHFIDCSAPGSVCPVAEGDGTVRDENSPLPEGAEDGGTPECEAGQECSVDGHAEGGDGTVSEAEPGSPADPGSGTAGTATTQTTQTAQAAAVPPTAAEIAAAAQTPAGRAVTSARATGLRVWLDTELADDWKAGPEAFAAAVKRVGALAARPEVAGIRFTAQLGYNTTFTKHEEITAFVAGAAAALRRAAPGKRLGVHTVVPAFACGADEACKAEMAERHPLLAPEKIESSLVAGQVDQVTLDTGLLYGGYTAWNIDAATAQRNQWIQVRARAWDVLAQVAAEETGLVGDVTAEEVATRVSTPVMDGGAQQINLWTRVQDAQGGVKHLTAWAELAKLGPIQRRLAAVYNPAAPATDPAADLKKISEVFGQVYLTTA
ncbi:hypothetical protein [Planomonospora venezuelensis]|uniref:Uncharacterized protein n=1 Tax=Planomonospora venezuelensis TaxID=1999 RepID=A0A841D905_PLAVE|nr:hypothetical protein [Planomonospora venezuelensis]MBB5965343.1 hypothetical protein [Planomonospora venezuelensis]GIN05624.1 hypothetical protein Pve01_72820 [Planomonospora venezuelensis]